MPWGKWAFGGSTDDFLSNLIKTVAAFVTDRNIHGDDAWELVRSSGWPYGTVFKIPNYQAGEYGYLGLMNSKIEVGSSYWDWLKQPDILRKNFVMNKNGLNMGFNDHFTIDNGAVVRYNQTDSKVQVGKDEQGKPVYSTNYRLNSLGQYTFSPRPEIFAQDASVIFFSMFKQYQERFDWSELMGNERRSIKIKPLKYYYNGQTYPSFFDPPLYPGVGCPALGYSPKFFDFEKNEYCNEDYKPRLVYLIKDRHRLTVVINFLDRWDVASVGFFEPFDTNSEYSFPAMTLGGTSGVLPMTELASYGGSPIVEHGFKLDYTEKNWALSHGIAPFSATWWDGTDSFLDHSMYSQVQAMLPDGNWQSFANFGLRQDVYYNRSQGMYYSGHKEPERIKKARYYITPNFSDISKTVNLLPTSIKQTYLIENETELKNRNTYHLEPLHFVQRSEDNINQNILGCIKNMYWCSHKVTRYGEYTLNGKKYLVIPSAWENRKYHIKHYFSALLGEKQSSEQQLAEINRLEELSSAMNCVIKLD